MSVEIQTSSAFGDDRPPHRSATTSAAATWTDTRLVRECVAGNADAWAALIEKYKRLIYSIPIKYGLSSDAANDIFQDVCVDLLSELPRLREPRALPKWLMQVTAHRCTRVRGHAARLPEAPRDEDEDPMARLADTQPLSEQIVLDVEREQALRDAIATLAPRCRRLVEMLFLETPPRSYQEAARSLQLETGSIGFIRGRCLKRLRTELQKYGFR